jgi:predicted aconitase
VGKLVGEPHQDYYSVPVFHGFHRTPTADELKHLGAALASYGSMGMFHFAGATPEAPSVEAALGDRAPAERLVITDADLERAYAAYKLGDGDARLVVFSGPQQSLLEMKRLAQLFEGRKVMAGASCFVTTSGGVLAQARALGYAETLEAAGVSILQGVCFYILQNLSPMRAANGWRNMVSNSAKIVNIIGAHRFNTILRRTRDCVDIACTGVLR